MLRMVTLALLRGMRPTDTGCGQLVAITPQREQAYECGSTWQETGPRGGGGDRQARKASMPRSRLWWTGGQIDSGK